MPPSTATANATTAVTIIVQTVHTQTVVICEGDSLTEASYPTSLASLLGGAYSVTNAGTGGETAEQMASETTALAAMCGVSHRTYYCFWGGTNDINAGGTAANTYNFIKQCWAALKAAGARVVAMNIIKRVTFDAGKEVTRQATNALIDSDPSLYDARIDLSARSEFSNTSDAAYFTDGTHLTAAGYAVVAQLAYDAIVALGG